jgi:hypothetical protein
MDKFSRLMHRGGKFYVFSENNATLSLAYDLRHHKTILGQ